MVARCEAAFHTQQGRRAENQDAARVDADGGWAVVADGMGGAPEGRRAANLAIEAAAAVLAEGCPGGGPAEALRRAVTEANGAVHREARTRPGCRGMGTTLVLALVCGERFAAGSVGDSRVYLLRGGALRQLTRDHSLVQLRVDAGLLTPDEALQAPDRHVLTLAVGTDAAVEPRVVEGDVEPGDLFLLTSDGVHGALTAAGIREAVEGRDPEPAAAAVAAAALAAGSTDNVTAAILRVDSLAP